MADAPHVKVYTTTYCGYCRAAKDLLQKNGIAYDEIDVTEDMSMRARLVEMSGQRTVPQIFWNGVSVGGYTDLSAKLPQLLAQG